MEQSEYKQELVDSQEEKVVSVSKGTSASKKKSLTAGNVKKSPSPIKLPEPQFKVIQVTFCCSSFIEYETFSC